MNILAIEQNVKTIILSCEELGYLLYFGTFPIHTRIIDLAMRLCLTFLSCLLLCLSLTAQGTVRGQGNQDIPDVVKETFLQNFPEARSAAWRKTGTYYTVGFDLDDLKMEATYSGTGIWAYTEITIPRAKMPEKILAHYQETYSSYPLVDMGYHDEENNRYYRLRIRKGGSVKMLKYDDNGTFIALE